MTMTLNVLVPGDQVADTLVRFDRTGVQWRRWWGLGCHTHPAFEVLPTLDLEVTRDLAPRVIGVPCHTGWNQASRYRVRLLAGCNGA